jgi:hypothetical protein
MKVYADLSISGQPIITSNLIIRSPESGFSLLFGNSTGEAHFDAYFGFSGYSGYVFDSEGMFFGGYRSGFNFSIESHIFTGENRVSYFFNNTIMNNNLLVANSTGINKVEFEKYGDSSVSLNVIDSVK